MIWELIDEVKSSALDLARCSETGFPGSGQEVCGEPLSLPQGRGVGVGGEEVEADVVGSGVEVFVDAVGDGLGLAVGHDRGYRCPTPPRVLRPRPRPEETARKHTIIARPSPTV